MNIATVHIARLDAAPALSVGLLVLTRID